MEELEQSWQLILTQYTETVGSNEQKLYIMMLKDVARIKITLDQVGKLIDVLRRYSAKPLEEMLNKLVGASFKFNPENPEQYDEYLKRCEKRAKGFLLDLHIKEAKIEALRKKHEGNQEAPDRIYFENMLITLSDHAGFHLTDRIMTSEFCARLNRYIKFVEHQNTKK